MKRTAGTCMLLAALGGCVSTYQEPKLGCGNGHCIAPRAVPGLTGPRGEPVPMIVTFSPCGSEKTLDFMQWLGIAFPRWLQNDLRRSRDILETSVALAIRIGEELVEYAREHRIPLGINVESVSVRKAEIDASVALFHALAARLKPTR